MEFILEIIQDQLNLLTEEVKHCEGQELVETTERIRQCTKAISLMEAISLNTGNIISGMDVGEGESETVYTEFKGSKITKITEGITTACISHEASDLLDTIMNHWEIQKENLKTNNPDHKPSEYGFAYWLVRWSGLIKPVILKSEEEKCSKCDVLMIDIFTSEKHDSENCHRKKKIYAFNPPLIDKGEYEDKKHKGCEGKYIEKVCHACPFIESEKVSHPGGDSKTLVNRYRCCGGFWEDQF